MKGLCWAQQGQQAVLAYLGVLMTPHLVLLFSHFTKGVSEAGVWALRGA